MLVAIAHSSFVSTWPKESATNYQNSHRRCPYYVMSWYSLSKVRHPDDCLVCLAYGTVSWVVVPQSLVQLILYHQRYNRVMYRGSGNLLSCSLWMKHSSLMVSDFYKLVTVPVSFRVLCHISVPNPDSIWQKDTFKPLCFWLRTLRLCLFLVTHATWVSSEFSIKCVGASHSSPPLPVVNYVLLTRPSYIFVISNLQLWFSADFLSSNPKKVHEIKFYQTNLNYGVKKVLNGFMLSQDNSTLTTSTSHIS